MRIALGCDSENASDALDPLRIAALAAGIAKDQTLDPTIFGAHDAFEMLTIRGADAIGISGIGRGEICGDRPWQRFGAALERDPAARSRGQ